MRIFMRALQIVGLLLGFYVLCALLIAALIGLDVFAFESIDDGGGRVALLLLVATVGAIVIVLRGVFVSTRVRRKDLPGIAVSRTDEPMLWQHITNLATAAGTRPPAEIRLITDVNAGVMEHARLLGLLPGKRRMLIGVPLLLAMPMHQFDAVIGHELGHYSGKDVRLGPLTARTRESVLGALNAVRGNGRKPGKKSIEWPGHHIYEALFKMYAHLVFRSTNSVSRSQEYAADRFAVSIAGRDNAAQALRELPVIASSYRFFLNEYVAAGLPIGLLPAPGEVFTGFQALIHDPKRGPELAKLRSELPDEKPHQYDSHPPTADRIAAILALPDDGRAVDDSSGRAIGLFRNPAAPLTALGHTMLAPHAAGRKAADWQTLTSSVAVAGLRERSKLMVDIVRLTIKRPARLIDFVDVVDAGGFDEFLAQIPRSEVANKLNATGRTAREFAKTQMDLMLNAWAALELIESGRAHYRHSWGYASGELIAGDGVLEKLDKAIEAVLAMDPDTAPLRAAMAEAGLLQAPAGLEMTV
jgi:Zn-dependent protease with chaperone function